LELYRALTDPLVDIRPRWSVIPRGMSDEVYSRWGHAAMAESQAAAAWQAWLLLGSETGVVSDGGEVFFVSPDSPARGRLQAGDVVLSWSLGGTVRPFVLSDGFERGVRAAFHREGKAAAGLTLRLTREGEPMTVRFPVTAPDLTAWPFLGLALAAVNPRTDPPVPVSFLPGDIGGPSGGLMLSLQSG
jgi:PDZ domain-containing secreted protein